MSSVNAADVSSSLFEGKILSVKLSEDGSLIWPGDYVKNVTAPLVIKNLKGKFCLPVKCSLKETGSVFFELSNLAALKEYF